MRAVDTHGGVALTWRSIPARMIAAARGPATDRSMSWNGPRWSAPGAVRATRAAAVTAERRIAFFVVAALRERFPAGVPEAVSYLAGPLAAYVSGATIRVDGGHIRSVH